MGQYNMFSDLKTPRDVTGYTLFRGTTDFTQLQQFDLYESGYPYLIVVSIPEFLRKMAERDTDVANLVNSYTHILEYEFRGLDSGLENITSDTQEITNGVQSMNVITKVNAPSASTFSMRYFEKSGSTMTKLHQLYLRSVKDPGTTFKTYNGLIGMGADQIQPQDAGFHKECFSFLYIHTDNTGMLVEQAAYLVGCMPTTAELQIYNGTKGSVEFQEITAEFTGFPIMGSAINARAKKILDWMNSSANANMVHRNSWDFNYAALTDANTGLAQSKLTSN
jgi:hypothetical protein